jgi:hypothetical protein
MYCCVCKTEVVSNKLSEIAEEKFQKVALSKLTRLPVEAQQV